MDNKTSLPSHTLTKQLTKFGLFGVIINIAGYMIFMISTELLMLSPYLIISILYPLSVSLTFFMNRKYTFQKIKVQNKRKALFLIIYFTAYLLNIAILYIGLTIFFMPSYIVQGLAIILLGIYLFFMQRKYVYK